MIALAGTANNYYQYGSYTLTWVPPSGSGATPTVCGVPIATTVSGALSGGASFSAPVADSYMVIPGPGQWHVAVTNVGNIAPISVNFPATRGSADVSSLLQTAANASGLLNCQYNTNSSTAYPTNCGGGASYPAAGIPDSSGSTWLASFNASNQIPGNFLTVFGASGGSHAPGAVPDPGATSGSTRFLSEAGTWMIPPGGGTGCTLPGVANAFLYDDGAGHCTGSTNFVRDSNNNLHLLAEYYGYRLNMTDPTGNCGGNNQCNILSPAFTQSTGQEQNALWLSPSFTGAGSNYGPVGNLPGWTVTHGIHEFPYFERRGIAQAHVHQDYFYKAGGDSAVDYGYYWFNSGCGIDLSAEGCTLFSEEMDELGETTGTLAPGTTNTAPLIAGGPSQPLPDDGYLIDTSVGVISSAFNGTGSFDGTVHAWKIPMTPGSIPLSTGICAITGNVNDPSGVRTTYHSDTIGISCNFGSLAAGSAIIVPTDAAIGPPEQIQISSGGTSSVTFSHALFHGGTSVIFQGGIAGKMVLVTDDKTRTGHNSTYFALGSTDGNNMYYCVLAFGACRVQLPRPGETAESSSSAVTIAPYAEVTSVNGSSFTVEPNPWYGVISNTGDTVFAAAPFFASGTFTWIKESNLNFPCNQALGGCRGYDYDFGGATATAAFTPFSITNMNTASYYAPATYTGTQATPQLPIATLSVVGPALHKLWLTSEQITGQPEAGLIHIQDNILGGVDYYSTWFDTNSGDAIFNDINNTGGTVHGIVTGQRRLDLASGNVCLGMDPAVGPSAPCEFDLSYGFNKVTSIFPIIINTNTSGVGAAVAAIDVTTTASPGGVPADVMHIHPNGTGKSILDTPVQMTNTLTLSGLFYPGTLYSAAGTPLPSCGSGTRGAQAVVSDATAPTYMGAYTSGGPVTADVICSFNGSSYTWLTH
jgi:hypothetical protein